LEDGPWTPIGSDPARFTGNFDGNKKTVSGLIINNTTTTYQGMFGYIGSGGTVKALKLDNVNIEGSQYIGVVAGTNRGMVQNCSLLSDISGVTYIGGVVGINRGMVQNCSVTGKVSATGDYAGGVTVTNADTCTVQNCSVTGKVSGNGMIGGVMSYNNGTVQCCYVAGDVSGTGSYIGGVAASNANRVENCYVTGNVSGTSAIGGVAGDSLLMQNCYATGDVTATAGSQLAGGMVGFALDNGRVYNCVALNRNVKTTTFVGRIFGGSNHTGSYDNNRTYARSDMIVTGIPGTDPRRNGADITPSDYNNENWWKTAANWNTPADAWFGANNDSWEWDIVEKLPKLRNVGYVEP
jgi:hypothetical protein